MVLSAYTADKVLFFQGSLKAVDENTRLQRSLYLLSNILPLLRHIQLEQRTELDIEASLRGCFQCGSCPIASFVLRIDF